MKKEAMTPEEFEEIKTMLEQGRELHRKQAEELAEKRLELQALEEKARMEAKLEACRQRQMWKNEIEKSQKEIQKSFILIFVCIVSIFLLIATTLPTNVLLTGLYMERGEIEYQASQYGWTEFLKEIWDQNVEVLNQTISESWYAALFAKSPVIVDFLIILGEIALTALLVWIIYRNVKSIKNRWKNLKEKGCLKHR